MSFIQQIVEYTIQKYALHDLKNHIYIFPSKRAVALFNQLLKDYTVGKNYLLPETKTIQEFVIDNSSLVIADELFLLQELYNIHQKITGNEQTFYQFASWGKLILKDFDEIDKYNIDTNYFFSVLQAHKEIDEHYETKELAQEYLQIFYTNIENEKQGTFYDDFVKTWQFLGETYRALNSFLADKNLAYEGMVYRKLLHNIEHEKQQLAYDKIVFCGFNAFTFCEEKILDTLLLQQQNKVETWWDIDDLFMSNNLHEAGNFLRHYKQKYTGENHHWCNDKATNPKIKIVAMPSNVGQIHYVRNHIKLEEKNAIVLCDETLIEHCQKIFNAKEVNITMGSPIQKSNIYAVLKDYLQCIQNSNSGEAQTTYTTQDIVQFFSNYEMKPFLNKENDLIKLSFYRFPININNISSYISDKTILTIFQSNTADAILKSCIQLLQIIQPKDENDKTIRQVVVNRLIELDRKINYNALCTFKDIFFIIQNYILTITIPFSTSRESNTQIMGFLETRLQDFDNLYILSLNDKILPGTNKSNSFIPYHLRKSFQLPTFDQFDGVNAYHFYRLLKRAKTIFLLYNNASNADSDAEKSRFIKQIEYEFDRNVYSIAIENATMKNAVFDKTNTALKINKDAALITQLYQMHFSASSINTYLTCPVQFYLKYLLKINIPEELNTNKEAADFGIILHKILENYYTQNAAPKVLDKHELTDYLIQSVVELGYPASYFKSNNALNKKIIEKLFSTILKMDSNDSFKILHLEKELATTLSINGTLINIKGKIDRIDEVDSAIRILDYKTGNVKLCPFPNLSDEKSISEFFDKIFNKKSTSYKETFQGMLYAWLYKKNYPNSSVLVGYYTAKKLQDGIQFLNDKNVIEVPILNLFEEKLIELLKEILDINTPFELSKNANAYKYNDAYKELLLL